jgi:hypothetical protein
VIAMNDHLDVAIALLKKSSDIDYRGVEGATALFEATICYTYINKSSILKQSMN